MPHPLTHVLKFCEWSWCEMPFGLESKSMTMKNLLISISQMSARAMEVCFIINYLAMTTNAIQFTESSTVISSIVMSHTVSVAMGAALIFLLARVLVYAISKLNTRPAPILVTSKTDMDAVVSPSTQQLLRDTNSSPIPEQA